MTDSLLTLNNYQTRLPSFEGPLDLLLRLIERQKLDISDVSLVLVTEQFLRHVEEIERTAPEIVAEFTAVGTRLTLLKSRSLLPKPPVIDTVEDVDPDDLVQQLRAYKRLKEVATQLGQRRDDGLTSFTQTGNGAIARPRHIGPMKLANYESSVLLKAIRRRLTAVPAVIQTIRQRRIVSIHEMTNRVLDAVSQRARVRFSTITGPLETRSEHATAFLATLVLIRRQVVNAEQPELFGEIDLARAAIQHDSEFGAAEMDQEFAN